jgi:hypothetical protein
VPEAAVDDGFPDLDGRGAFPDRDEIIVEHVAEGSWEPAFAAAIDVAICFDLASREWVWAEHFQLISERASNSIPGK